MKNGDVLRITGMVIKDMWHATVVYKDGIFVNTYGILSLSKLNWYGNDTYKIKDNKLIQGNDEYDYENLNINLYDLKRVAEESYDQYNSEDRLYIPIGSVFERFLIKKDALPCIIKQKKIVKRILSGIESSIKFSIAARQRYLSFDQYGVEEII